jgi:hypothetical protein
MFHLMATPEFLVSAATDLSNIGADRRERGGGRPDNGRAGRGRR